MSLAYSSFSASFMSYGGGYTGVPTASASPLPGGFTLTPQAPQLSRQPGLSGQPAFGQQPLAGQDINGLMGQMLQMMQLMLQAVGTLFGAGSGGNGVSPVPGPLPPPGIGQDKGATLAYLESFDGRLDASAIAPLLSIYGNLDPGSPEAQKVEQQLEGLQPGIMSSDFGLKARQVQLLNVQAALHSVASNLDPAGPEAQQIQQRISAVRMVQAQLDLTRQTKQNDLAIAGLLLAPGATPLDAQHSQALIRVLQSQKVQMADLFQQLQQKIDSVPRAF